ILNAALSLQENYPRKKIILVSKDICLRLKAKALNLLSEDYETGKIKNVDELYTGSTLSDKVSEKALNELSKRGFIGPMKAGIAVGGENHFYLLKGSKKQAAAYYNPASSQLEHIPEQSVFR